MQRHSTIAGMATVMVMVATPALAQDRKFDIPAQSASTGIAALGRQAGVQILAARRDTRGKRTSAVSGALSVDQALARLLAGTGLTVRMTGAQTYSVVPTAAVSDEGDRNAQATIAEPKAGGETGKDIIVTGSNIRGAEIASPLRTYTHAQIEAEGDVTLEQFARNLPQNFSSTNRETSALGTSGTSDNGAFGSGFNLRGLGAQATLTLINGHRVAPGGSQGAFVDISTIPLAAVERIDVLTDGSSAIYGSDAIAGVVNIVLRNRYNGAETSVYDSIPTRGGGREIGVSQLLGKTWSTGNIMITGDYYDADPISSKQRDFVPSATFPLGYALSPDLERYSVFGSAEQNVGSALTLFAQGSYNHQKFMESESLLSFLTTQINGTQDTYSGTGGARLALGARWTAELSGSYATAQQQDTSLSSFISFPIPPSTTKGYSRTRLASGQVRVNGDLFDLPGGTVKTAFGYEHRHESYHSETGVVGSLTTVTNSSRNVDGVFGELSVPVVGSDNGIAGLRRLLFTGALRYDHYSDVGGAVSPKLGAVWTPIEGLDLRGTWGTSFRPALLSQLDPNGVRYALVPFSAPGGKTIDTLYALGANPALKPERSTAFTAGFALKPHGVPGLELSVGYYSIDYRNKIAMPPIVGGVAQAFFSPTVIAPFLSMPATPTEIAAAYATGRVVASGGLTQASIQAYLNDQLNNVARAQTSGLEFNLNYTVERPFGRVSAGIDGNWIFTLRQKAAAGQSSVKLDNVEFQPADFRMNASLGWSKSGAHVTTTLRYVGGYTDTLVTPYGSVSNWLTADIALGYDFGAHHHGPFNGLRAQVAVQNLFDNPPPFLQISPTSGVTNSGYDPTNATAIGRTVSLRLTKAW